MNRIVTFLLTLIVVAFVWSSSVFILQGLAEPRERRIEVLARKFSYTPNIITLNRGDKVTIRLISEDVHHGLFIDGYNINTAAYLGNDGIITFQAARTGTFPFRCSVTCGELHPYMIGYLNVLPNTRFFFFLWTALGIAALILWKIRK